MGWQCFAIVSQVVNWSQYHLKKPAQGPSINFVDVLNGYSPSSNPLRLCKDMPHLVDLHNALFKPAQIKQIIAHRKSMILNFSRSTTFHGCVTLLLRFKASIWRPLTKWCNDFESEIGFALEEQMELNLAKKAIRSYECTIQGKCILISSLWTDVTMILLFRFILFHWTQHISRMQ